MAAFREFPLPATALGGTHVLLIGVDGYQHLPPEDGSDANVNGKAHAPGLRQLSTSVPSIENLANWFLDGTKGQGGFQSSEQPLESIDILLSPGQFTETGMAPVPIREATHTNIRNAVHDWRNRAHTKQQNRALFFFVGHGMEGVDHYLLPTDAFEDNNAPGEKLIKLHTMITRMGSCRAGVQMFFVDACRSQLGNELQTAENNGEDFCAPFLLSQPSIHPRYAPIYRAAPAKGKPATGRSVQPTFFTEGLLDCLNHHGAEDNGGFGKFWVTVNSLREALAERMKRLSLLYSLPLNCDFTDKTSTPPAISQNVHQIPDNECRVLAQVTVIPDARLFDRHMWIEGGNGNVVLKRAPAGQAPAANEPKVWLAELPPGSYSVSARDPADITRPLAGRTAEFRMPVDQCKLPVP